MASATACLSRVLSRVILSLPPIYLVLVLIPFSVVSCSASPTSPDRTALLAFKSSLSSDGQGALTSWSDASFELCSWRGVSCGSRRQPQRVTEVNLQSLGLSGPISTAIANLTFLERLDLSNNSFHGRIPREIGRLSNLRHLNMSFNSLGGRVPARLARCSDLRNIGLENNFLAGSIPWSLGNLSSLQLLSLSQNRLGGRIPASLSKLRSLRKLMLSANRFEEQIPTQLGNLSSLEILYLQDNTLSGVIPSSLGSLSSLEDMRLSMNHLEGSIPPTLGNLQRLRVLDLTNNSLSGTIPPTISNLSSLRYLSIYRNHLVGSIPPLLGGISSLIDILLHENNLTGGIPPCLGNLTILTVLSLRDNSFHGPIPDTIGRLTSLNHFSASDTMLTGSIPPSIYNLSSLVTFELAGNKLTGTLPPDIGVSLPNLQFLSLFDNQFHGSIPSSIVNASSLWSIQLHKNKFSGILPSRLGNLKALEVLQLSTTDLEAKDDHDWSFLSSLANCTRLRVLILCRNKLGGVLPSAISGLSRDLQVLDLGFNHISGSIPEGVGNLSGLNALALDYNHLNGLVPNSIGMLHGLAGLFLDSNNFSGQLPSAIFNLTKLSRLSLHENKLEGSIPPDFGNLQNLEGLDLSCNKFSGNIPKELVSISSLSMLLNLSYNSLFGVMPSEASLLRNLNVLDVSHNKLSGEIPGMLGDCELLTDLLIQGNAFHGVIPESFSKLGGLESLDLSQNYLSGKIPEFFRNFNSLNYLNLSYNDFDGELPKGGVFVNASAVFVQGNHRLCGGIKELHLQTCFSEESRGHGRHTVLITIIVVVGSSVCLLIFVLYVIFSRYTRRKASFPMVPSNDQFERITYAQLFKSTDGFSHRNLIGKGSFGSVYVANMDPTNLNGKIVAVKVINIEQRGASRSFMAECEAFRIIRHRNLVKILTTCSSIDFSGKDFKALVLDFMPKGTLEQWLHPKENEGEKHLSLLQRLNVAIDVASALAYLHHQCYKTIVHCDLKPSNVLLDDEMIGHVSDFGLSKFLNNSDKTASTSSLAFRGSIGYVAPEYGMGCNPSIDGDVFSYGVMLLEMITGRKPTDAAFVDNLTLHKFVEMAFSKHLLDIVDPYLLIEGNMNTHDIYQGTSNMSQRRLTCLVSMARLGLICSKESPKERLKMEIVIKEMSTIRDTFIRAGDHPRMRNSYLGL